MAETKQEESKKPLKLSRPGRLELKKTVETGTVKQSFSHGRSKQVAVEVKRKRTFKRGEGDSMSEVKEAEDLGAFGPGQDGRLEGPLLSEAERQARRRALDAAQQAESHDEDMMSDRGAAARAREDAEAMFATEAAPEAEPEAEAPAEPEAAEAPAAEEAEAAVSEAPAPAPDETAAPREREAAEARAEADRLARELAEQELGQLQFKPSSKVPPKPATPPPTSTPADAEAAEAEEKGEARVKKRGGEAKRPASPSRRGEPKRREGRLTITQALEIGDAGMERKRSEAATRRRRERERQRQREQASQTEYKKQSREVVVPEAITVQELANRMAEKGSDLVKALMKMDVMATINQTIDADTAELLVEEFGHRIKRVSEADVELGLGGEEDRPEDLKSRAPVVTVMGHVDHGKTSLLDALRETDVVAREAGGITQHIGAYQVALSSGQRITFLDTPGHAAFTQMRARGANVTDIVVLVVAADDGVQPQTMEAIAHAKAAEVPIIVAINKIDVKGADPNRVRTELLQHDIQVEEMGGDVLSVEVSAKEKTNLDKLEEAILLQAELLELKANPDRPAQGIVVEAKLERGRGPVATVLIQRGTLNVGDIFIAGGEWGRVRALVDDRGDNTESAGPSSPVEVLGLQGTPSAGDEFSVVENEGRAREISEYRQRTAKKEAVAVRGSIEQMFSMIKAGEAQELPVLIKADVQGSAEAITGMLEGLSTEEVKVQVLHSGVGAISESDITLANASGGLIIAFNVRANAQARELAERDGVDIRYYSVIYDINDDIRGMLSGMLAPEKRETFLGYAEILEVFKVSKVGNVAGCRVTEGLVKRGAGVRLLRDNVVIHEGKLATLKRFKDEVKEVRGGMECGMSFENYQDIRVGDQIECYEVEEVAREL